MKREEHQREWSMSVRHLSQTELAARWNISHRTLERWRWTGGAHSQQRSAARISDNPLTHAPQQSMSLFDRLIGAR